MAGLKNLFDAVLSADGAQVPKTQPRVHDYALQHLGLSAQQVSFRSSNGWDAFAASAFGMRAVWCNRRGQARERLPSAPDHEARALAEPPPLLAAFKRIDGKQNDGETLIGSHSPRRPKRLFG